MYIIPCLSGLAAQLSYRASDADIEDWYIGGTGFTGFPSTVHGLERSQTHTIIYINYYGQVPPYATVCCLEGPDLDVGDSSRPTGKAIPLHGYIFGKSSPTCLMLPTLISHVRRLLQLDPVLTTELLLSQRF